MANRIAVFASIGTNLGVSAGDVRMGKIKAIFLTRGKVFSPSEIADSPSLLAAMKVAVAQSRDNAGKVFILDGFNEVDDKTPEPSETSLLDGYSEVLNRPVPKYQFKNTKGVAAQNAIVTFRGFTGPVFLLDTNNILWYKIAANGGAQGFPVGNFDATSPKPGGGSAINVNMVYLTLASSDVFEDNVGAIKLDWTTSSLTNPQDVLLKEVAASATSVFKIGVSDRFTSQDLYTLLKAGLSQTGAWKITKVSDGSAVTVSSITANDTTKSFNLATTGLTAGDKVLIELKDGATLAGLTTPVIGFESVPLAATLVS